MAEWKNIANSEVPEELIDKLARSLFTSDDPKGMDIHPAETLLSAVFGKAGSFSFDFPNKVQVRRSELSEAKEAKRKPQ